MKTMWIGLQEQDLLCGSERGRDLVERMRGGSLIRIEHTALQAITYQGKLLGFGVICALHRDDNIAVDTAELKGRFESIRRTFGRQGIGGRFTVNLEDTDPPRYPKEVLP